MTKRDNIISAAEEILGKDLLVYAAQKDELANGVQILGGHEVKKVALGVTVNTDLLEEGIQSGANFFITHHGLDARVHKSRFPISTQKRLKLIFQNDLTIMAFHYALDAHPEIGNNATIIKKLGAQRGNALFEEWGYVGKFRSPQNVKMLADKCSRIMEHDVLAIYSGPEEVKTIGVCSGAAKPYAQHMAELEEQGVELFISGETSESIPNRMKESEINYFVCGHYATEVFGVQELGKALKSRFKDRLEVEFIDIPNPI